jgi:hypothetical protein
MWWAKHEFLREKRKKKDFSDASKIQQLHASHMERKKAKTNQITQRYNIFHI